MKITTSKGALEARAATVAERRRLSNLLVGAWRFGETTELRDPEIGVRLADEVAKMLEPASRELFDLMGVEQPFAALAVAVALCEGVSGEGSGG